MTIAENKKFTKDMLNVARANLKSVSILDIIDADKLSAGDRKNYLAAAHETYLNPVFHNELKNLIALQKDFVAMQAENERQSDYGRGVINGAALLYERIQQLNFEYESSLREKSGQEFDPMDPMAEI